MLDTGSQLIYNCQMKIPKIWTFNILKEGSQLGQITKKWSGVGKEFFTKADNFLVDFGSVAEKDRDLLLALAFIVDITAFEHK